MQEEHFEFEDMVINRMSLLDSINQLASEIQKWILEEYGDFKTFSEMIENKERVCELFEFLIAKKWTGRKQKVIFLRFGIIDGKTRSLEEVAAIMGTTRERVRMIESSLLRGGLGHKLQRSKTIRDYLEG